jgi:hypothetical protein
VAKIDSAIDQAPAKTEKVADLAAALDILNPVEKELLGAHWFAAQRAIERLSAVSS